MRRLISKQFCFELYRGDFKFIFVFLNWFWNLSLNWFVIIFECATTLRLALVTMCCELRYRFPCVCFLSLSECSRWYPSEGFLLISPFYSLVTNKLLVVATQIANQPGLKFIIKFVLYKDSISTRRVPIFVVEKDNNKVMSSIRTTGVKMSTKQHTYQLSRTNWLQGDISKSRSSPRHPRDHVNMIETTLPLMPLCL